MSTQPPVQTGARPPEMGQKEGVSASGGGGKKRKRGIWVDAEVAKLKLKKMRQIKNRLLTNGFILETQDILTMKAFYIYMIE